MAYWSPIHTAKFIRRWGDAIPEHDPRWDNEDHVGQARMRHYSSIRRNERYMVKPVNDKIPDVIQEERGKPGSLPEPGDQAIQEVHQSRP